MDSNPKRGAHGQRASNRSDLHRNEKRFRKCGSGFSPCLPLYVVSYLDRINIGFAALTMNKELDITSQQFGLLAGIFFFGYSLRDPQ